jgi:hypothetical protein
MTEKVSTLVATDTASLSCERCLSRAAKVEVVVPIGLGENYGWAYCEMSLCGGCVDEVLPSLKR